MEADHPALEGMVRGGVVVERGEDSTETAFGRCTL